MSAQPGGVGRGDDAVSARSWRRVGAALAAAAWVAGLFALSSWAVGDAALGFWWRFPHDDKLVHTALYAVLGGLLRVASGRPGAAVAIAGAVGIADELWQSTIPGRSADPLDWVADVLGAFAGATLVGASRKAAVARRRRGRALE